MMKSNPVSGPMPDIRLVRLPFRAVVTPNRSLSPRGFALLMLVFGAASFATGMVFLMQGAWPVMGFFGLDVAMVWLAFRLNYREGRASETIRITRETLEVLRRDAKGREAVTEFDPYWARVERSENRDLGLLTLYLAERGRRLEIARVLSPGEKRGLAAALDRALALARGAVVS